MVGTAVEASVVVVTEPLLDIGEASSAGLAPLPQPAQKTTTTTIPRHIAHKSRISDRETSSDGSPTIRAGLGLGLDALTSDRP